MRKSPKMAKIAAFYMSFTQQMIGLGAVCIYGGEVVGQVLPSIKKLTGFIINSSQFIGLVLLAYLMPRYPRKTILQFGMLTLFIFDIIIAIAFSQYKE